MTAEVWIRIGASILLGFLVFVIMKLWLWPPIEHPLAVVGQRVQDLEDTVEMLGWMGMELRRLDPIPWSQRCKGWVQSVRDLRVKAHEIKVKELFCRRRIYLSNGCGLISYLSKWYLGKQATKELIKRAADLIEEGEELLKQAQARPRRAPAPAPARAVPVLPRNQLWGMDSYKQEALDFIGGGSSGLLAIVGIPGVGKTSLLELVRDSPEVRALSFDHVLFVRAGRGATAVTMQKAIAVSLGLLPLMPDDDGDQTYLNLRARIIYKHLRRKSFLLLIDDLCGYHDLKYVGIPMPRTSYQYLLDDDDSFFWNWDWDARRKAVFTTRSYDVCHKMMRAADNTVVFEVECLSEADAWDLFISKVGNEKITTCNFESHARKLVDECRGLPLALCTIGRAMSTKKDPEEWKRAIDLLQTLELWRYSVNPRFPLVTQVGHSAVFFSQKNQPGQPNQPGSSPSEQGINPHGSKKKENDLKTLRETENDSKTLRETTSDFVGTSDDLMKAVLALVVTLTPVSKDRIVSYIRLKEMDRPSLHGMGSYKMKVLGFVEDETPSKSLLGIWGVPGVGRTTLLRFVRDYAHELFPYDAFFVRAGSGCTVRRLQHALCVSIGLDPPPLHMIDVSLKEHIFSSLKDTPFLLLVDDVSERLDLKALGLPIPLGHNQKVIFTTTDDAICTEMGCTEDTSIHMKCLGQEDAWNLFNDKVGHEIINDHPHIKRLAKQMVDECLGLPSALCTLGRAMSTKRDVKEWRYAYDLLLRMKSPQVDRIRKTNDDRYPHLYHLQDTLLKHSFF